MLQFEWSINLICYYTVIRGLFETECEHRALICETVAVQQEGCSNAKISKCFLHHDGFCAGMTTVKVGNEYGCEMGPARPGTDCLKGYDSEF